MKSHKSCHSPYAWRIECKHNQLWCQFGFFRKLKQKLYICSDSTKLFVRSANLALVIAYLFIEGTFQNMSPVICEVFISHVTSALENRKFPENLLVRYIGISST